MMWIVESSIGLLEMDAEVVRHMLGDGHSEVVHLLHRHEVPAPQRLGGQRDEWTGLRLPTVK